MEGSGEPLTSVRVAPGVLSAPSLEGVFEPDNLYRAWELVRDRATLDGTPSAGVAIISRDPAATLVTLAEELGRQTYSPAPLLRVEIPKPAGGVRRLSIPAVRDRIVERAVHQALEPAIDPLLTPWSFGYRAGLGVREAIAAVCEERAEGALWVARCDFADCFDSLRRRRLLATLSRHITDRRLLRLVELLIGRAVRIGFRVEPRIQGAPQGSPLSPLLCNLYLDAFDQGMLARGWHPIRYGDDVLVQAVNRGAATKALESARSEAAAVELELGERKTRVGALADGIEYLGVRIDMGSPTAPGAVRPTPRGKALYVTRPGSWVGSSGGQITVKLGKEQLFAAPAAHIGHIVLCGNVSLSAQARNEALQKGVEVVFLSGQGRYLGRLDPAGGGGELRRLQFERSADPAWRLQLARRFVDGKLANLRALLLRRHRRGSGQGMVAAARSIERSRLAAAVAKDMNGLLGVEGSASRAYFGAIKLLVDDELAFEERRRRPPKDPVNAALSFGYSLLARDAVGAAAAAGLDPSVGFLHGPHRGRPSLALDLMEEFRPLIVDTVVLEAFSRGVLSRDHFREAGGGAQLLTPDGLRAFLSAYEERQLTTFNHVPSAQRVSYRRAIFLQARQVVGLLQGHRRHYRPVAWR
jgi:CRISPR-associated protein Cas1